MRTIAVLNQKGGVGKTTTVANTAAALAMLGRKVIAMDMDPQSHLTIHLGVDPERAGNGSYEVLAHSADFTESLVKVRQNLWLMSASIDLVGAESELVSVVGRETVLREAIEPIRNDYDYLIIDCPPSLGLLSLNALAAVQEVFIPLEPNFLALQGFGKLLETVTLVSRRINPSLKVMGVLLCMFDRRVTLSTEVKTDIQQFLESARGTDCPWGRAQMLPVHVRRNIKLAEAPSYGKTIFEYAPNCNGAEDYKMVAQFIDQISGDLPDTDTEDVLSVHGNAVETHQIASESVVMTQDSQQNDEQTTVSSEAVETDTASCKSLELSAKTDLHAANDSA